MTNRVVGDATTATPVGTIVDQVVIVDPATGLPVAFPSGTASSNLAQVNGVTVDVGTGAAGPGTQRVAVASDSTILAKGPTASGAALAVAPLTTGGLAKTANPTAVADGQVVNELHDKLGKVVAVSALRNLKAVQNTTITSSTAETTIVTAAGANVFADIYKLVIANTSATACNVTIKDDTAGTTRFVIAVPAGETRGFVTDAGSATPQAVANKPWTATCSASVASITITAETVQNL